MRELIWLLIVVLFGYAAFQLVCALRIKLKKTGPGQKAGNEGTLAKITPQNGDGEFMTLASLGSDTSPALDTPSSTEPVGDAFQLTLEVQQMRLELARVHGDFISQREQIQRIEEGLALLKEQLESAVASQGVSPEYNEALVFARRGLAVDAIAERCGISVAEAELVRSLAQGGTIDREGA